MYKKLTQLNLLIYIVIVLISFSSCTNVYKGKFEVIKYHKSDGIWSCYIKKEENKYLVIDFKRRYKDGTLIEYEGCASEGKYIENFTRNNDYSREDKLVKNLSIQRTNKDVIYFNETYPIIRQDGDSVFVKTKSTDEYYVFIGEIPFKK